MKLPIAVLFAALTATAVAASAAPAPAPASPPAPKLSKWQQLQAENFKNSAPADEYFGKMKMSFLGMNNTFRDASISSGDHTTNPGIINKVALAEDALDAWARKYPRDPQLARTYFLATQVDRKIWVKANQDHAWIYLNRLVELFPTSYFGKILKRDLAIGFTEHYYALPVPCATPSPSPSPTDAGLTAGTPSPAPPTPTPGPVETTLQKGLKVEIIPQACVPPATPPPSPSPPPSPPAAPGITAAPDASLTATPAASPSP